MTPNNNLSILPFYNSLEKQNHRKDYAFNELFSLISPWSKILPFQFMREASSNTISSVVLVDFNNNTRTNITAAMLDTGLVVNKYEANGYDVVMYPGILQISVGMHEGRYYLEVNDGNIYYSEVFTVVLSIDKYLKIEYYDTENFEFGSGVIDFTNNFKFNLYLNAQVGKPEYPFEETVDKRDGYTFIEKQISEKTYKFNFLAPEFLLDAIRIIRMCDYINITCKGEKYSIDTFLLTPKWQDTGYIASVEAEFQCDTVIKKISGRTLANAYSDFNNDYNNDFDK